MDLPGNLGAGVLWGVAPGWAGRLPTALALCHHRHCSSIPELPQQPRLWTRNLPLRDRSLCLLVVLGRLSVALPTLTGVTDQM